MKRSIMTERGMMDSHSIARDYLNPFLGGVSRGEFTCVTQRFREEVKEASASLIEISPATRGNKYIRNFKRISLTLKNLSIILQEVVEAVSDMNYNAMFISRYGRGYDLVDHQEVDQMYAEMEKQKIAGAGFNINAASLTSIAEAIDFIKEGAAAISSGAGHGEEPEQIEARKECREHMDQLIVIYERCREFPGKLTQLANSAEENKGALIDLMQ